MKWPESERDMRIERRVAGLEKRATLRSTCSELADLVGRLLKSGAPVALWPLALAEYAQAHLPAGELAQIDQGPPSHEELAGAVKSAECRNAPFDHEAFERAFLEYARSGRVIDPHCPDAAQCEARHESQDQNRGA